MQKPTILCVDDDPEVLASIGRDLRSQYGRDYRIMKASSGAQALQALGELALRARPVALIASDQRMPEMSGTDMLVQARELAPDAKMLLLTAYADTDAAIQAINDVGLDYYLRKPWDPPEDRLYPVVDDLLGDWRQAHPDDSGQLRVVGHRWSSRSHEVKTFLTRNHVPYQWLEVDRDEEAARLVELADAGLDELPLVLVPDVEPLRAPSNLALADALGLRTRAEQPLYDLCIVGGGPAGLAAAVYAASEGLRAVVVEKEAPAGRPGRARRSRTTWGSPRACRAPTWRTARSPRRRASGRRCCWHVTSSGWRRAARSGRCCSTAAATSRRAPWSSRAASPTAASRVRGCRSWPAAASTTAPRRARGASARATTCTSSAAPTPPARRR
jgi:thioredoxin reductase (NADPH)